MARIKITTVTFRLPLGNTGRMDEPQTRMLIETVQQYRLAVDPRMQVESVRKRIRNGEKLLMRRNGGWYPLNPSVQELKRDEILVVG